MPILDAVKERIEPALETARERIARGAVRIARADLTADAALSGVVDGFREWLSPHMAATKERLAPKVDAARERLAPVAAAARERLAPVVEPLSPVIDRVKEFGEIAVGSAPEAEEVADPVGELRGYFEIQDTIEIEPLTRQALKAGAPPVAEAEEELEVPPYRPWALSTLDEAPEREATAAVRGEPAQPPTRRRERVTLV